MVKLKLKEVPQFEQKERYALERMRSLSINGKKSILSRLSNEEVSALGSLTAKYHLMRIIEHINFYGCVISLKLTFFAMFCVFLKKTIIRRFCILKIMEWQKLHCSELIMVKLLMISLAFL